MIGVGPFITIPLLMTALGGPQAMLGWIVALVIVICDGMVWSELGAAMPGSGGSFRYLREAFGRETFGRLMAFLFVWQFVLSGPLEIASGYIGFAQYASYHLERLDARRAYRARHRRRPGQRRAALSAHRLDRAAHDLALDRRTLVTTLAVVVTGAHALRRARGVRLPARRVSILARLLPRPRRGVAHRRSTTTSATTTSATSATR